MDDGTLADVCELRQRGDDGLVRRRDDGPAFRRVRRSSRRHDARRGAETRSELEDGPNDGGLDWHRIRLFSSTAEPSTPEEMVYLMFLAGYRPVVEYCGGTEVGGAYITGSVVRPCAPSTFTTPAFGLDFEILDGGHPTSRGELFLVPPSIGLSTELLNYDNDEEYYDGVPEGPHGERLR